MEEQLVLPIDSFREQLILQTLRFVWGLPEVPRSLSLLGINIALPIRALSCKMMWKEDLAMQWPTPSDLQISKHLDHYLIIQTWVQELSIHLTISRMDTPSQQSKHALLQTSVLSKQCPHPLLFHLCIKRKTERNQEDMAVSTTHLHFTKITSIINLEWLRTHS